MSHASFVKLDVTLWAAWWARRKIVHEGVYQSPLSTNLLVNRFIPELGEVNRTTNARSTTSSRRSEPTRMDAPPPGFALIHVDAGFQGRETVPRRQQCAGMIQGII